MCEFEDFTKWFDGACNNKSMRMQLYDKLTFVYSHLDYNGYIDDASRMLEYLLNSEDEIRLCLFLPVKHTLNFL